MSDTTPPLGNVPRVPLTPANATTDPALMAQSLANSDLLPIGERLELARSTAAMRSIIMPPTSNQATLRQFIGLGVGLGVALILMFFLIASLLSSSFSLNVAVAPVLTATPRTKIVAAPPATDTSGYGFATQVANPTPLPYTGEIPTLEPTITPLGGPPTATPAPATATTVPNTPAAFTVDQSALRVICNPVGTGTFKITNTGGGALTWQAKNSLGYSFNPSEGTLAPTAAVTVTVTSITVANSTPNGTITVNGRSSDNDAPSQTITVTCKQP